MYFNTKIKSSKIFAVENFLIYGIDDSCMYVLSQSRTMSSSGTGRPIREPAVQFQNWQTIIVTLP